MTAFRNIEMKSVIYALVHDIFLGVKVSGARCVGVGTDIVTLLVAYLVGSILL